MASLDVESLFTNIPLDETIENKMIYFWQLIKFIILKGKNLKQLLTVAAFESFFINDGDYTQIDVAMVSIGPNTYRCFSV